jgi:PKD repeat protein
LLAVFVSVAVVTASGCGSGSSSGGSSSSTTPVVTNATPGTYNVTVTAVSGNLVHSAVVTLTVQ